MTKHLKSIEILRNKGCRLTPQRLLILSVVADGGGHMGVDEVFSRAQESYPYLDIATVYRTLHLFKKLGVMTEVGIDDRLHFELNDPGKGHHHMVCRVCSATLDLSPSYLEGFRQALVKQFGFTPDLDSFTVPGLCAECAKKEAAGGNRPMERGEGKV